MNDKETINYLITTLIGTRILVDYDSEASEFITHALNFFDADIINKASLEADSSKSGSCVSLVEKFISSVISRNKGRVVGFDRHENGAFNWKVKDSEGNLAFVQTTELNDIYTRS